MKPAMFRKNSKDHHYRNDNIEEEVLLLSGNGDGEVDLCDEDELRKRKRQKEKELQNYGGIWDIVTGVRDYIRC